MKISINIIMISVSLEYDFLSGFHNITTEFPLDNNRSFATIFSCSIMLLYVIAITMSIKL